MYNKKNTLLRYKEILDVYKKYKQDDIPNSTIYKKYIYPMFKISIRTLYKILETPVDKELKELESTHE